MLAWTEAPLWQDGIGVVPDRDSELNPVRIEPRALEQARTLLLWALGRVAHGNAGWLDLKQFLQELWSSTWQDGIDFFWHDFTWMPDFNKPRKAADFTLKEGRLLAFWLEQEGVWCANALLGTLAFLGLVERAGLGEQEQPCFRLTEVGRVVFAAPEDAGVTFTTEPKFLVVQPNHEVVVYLDGADAAAVWPLAAMARRVSGAGVSVQTFALTRESVYEALESGVSLETIRNYLSTHSRTGLPAKVAQSLLEWGRQREAVTLRTGVSFAVAAGTAVPSALAQQGRLLSESCVLLPPKTVHGWKGFTLQDQQKDPTPCWRVEEDGRIRVEWPMDAVALARLSQFADPEGDGWQISAASVGRAHGHGIPADQVLLWLEEHALRPPPPLVETLVRNWSSPRRIFFGPLLMVQIGDSQAYTTIASHPDFQPCLLGQLPPNWFIVRAEQKEEMEQRLKEMGFLLDGQFPKAKGVEGSGASAAKPKAGPPKKKSK